MPVLDMPLEELRRYRGISPKPDDFDEYWSRALSEMERVDPCVSIVPSEFQTPFADCFDLYFTGVRGARIHAKLLKPKRIEMKCPAVVRFHGYTCDAGDWLDKLPYAAAGFVVAAMDCRGQGGSSEDTGGVKGNTLHGHFIRGLENDDPQDLLMRHVFLDCAELVKIVSSFGEVDPGRVGAYGGSQGGGLTLACASLAPVARLALCYPFLSDYRRVWEMDMDVRAYAELREFFRHTDPLHRREEEFFRKLGYIDVHHLAPRITGRTLMAVTLLDDICPPSTQFAAYNAITAPKEIQLYPDFGHEGLPGFDDETFSFLLGL